MTIAATFRPLIQVDGSGTSLPSMITGKRFVRRLPILVKWFFYYFNFTVRLRLSFSVDLDASCSISDVPLLLK